jgi:hypothetical protein
MRKMNLALLALIFWAGVAVAQNHKQVIDKTLEEREAISHFRFLAADELMGRDPIRPEMKVASRYIAEQFRRYGAMPVPGANEYYQDVPFRLSAPPTAATIKMGDKTLNVGEDMVVIDGPNFAGSYELVVAGYGFEADLAGKDLKGKIVVVRVGAPDRLSPADLFAAGREKMAIAQAKGAVGLIEMYNVPTTPWNLLVNFLNRRQFGLDDNPNADPIPYMWVRDLTGDLISAIDKGEVKKADINVVGKINQKIPGHNVIAWIEGTDPVLKNEFLMLSAHYDHVGVGRPDASGDSIYNGARDNAVGTVALINAAKYFSENKPKRSILICAWTAEEKGLLGSAYFAENPLIPLDKIIYNLNIDNAGYNDTSVITVMGLGRTTADDLISKAVSEYGMEAIPDPAPEQNLFDRSDNVNFARKGIPAPTFSLGFRAFDDEINKYYHQPADEVGNFDLDYAMKYWKSYLLAARYIADMAAKPFWQPGDKYEQVGKTLYGIK